MNQRRAVKSTSGILAGLFTICLRSTNHSRVCRAIPVVGAAGDWLERSGQAGGQ